MCAALHDEIVNTLQWYAEHGVDCCVEDEPVNRFEAIQELPIVVPPTKQTPKQTGQQVKQPEFLGTSDAYEEAIKSAKRANTLEELQQELQSFEGIAIKKTATNLVFADGNPESDIMIIGEAPGADEDRQGKPFVGVNGQILDKMLACIDLNRVSDDPKKAVYISNILNWRPPGNRTPTPAEIELSLPFIERHIQLIQPKILVLSGSVAAKSLLNTGSSISKLRKSKHEYTVITSELKKAAKPIVAIATYHPSHLLRTPAQKKHAWNDILHLHKMRSIV